MKILVDADACPVKNIIVKVAKEFDLPVIMLMDVSHIYSDGFSEVVYIDKARDSVDIALVNRTSREDVVVTQDYGLAAMVISKGAYALNQNGLVYDNGNIDRLLFERHMGQKIRRAGGRTSSPQKRKNEDNIAFEASLRNICTKKASDNKSER